MAEIFSRNTDANDVVSRRYRNSQVRSNCSKYEIVFTKHQISYRNHDVNDPGFFIGTSLPYSE